MNVGCDLVYRQPGQVTRGDSLPAVSKLARLGVGLACQRVRHPGKLPRRVDSRVDVSLGAITAMPHVDRRFRPVGLGRMHGTAGVVPDLHPRDQVVLLCPRQPLRWPGNSGVFFAIGRAMAAVVECRYHPCTWVLWGESP